MDTLSEQSGEALQPRGLCQEYDAAPAVYDEMRDAHGAIRPHWRQFAGLLNDLGASELERRWETARQLIHDNGVTYNVYGDPAGMDRPWHLDAIPVLFSAAEWAGLERGLRQRARLLDLVLADLYGQQTLIEAGLVPPQLVFGNPGFLRPMHGVKTPAGRWIHFYSADIGRGDDGRLHILADRTQTPSGAGYALENRLVITRALPDVFGDCRVRRLAGFFRTMRDTLKLLAPRNRDNPRIVLLTPGPYNETYFEHAYLARYLGYTLVEGADLTVRDNVVYLKTLGGLQQVDVILRRQDDDFCDPLELRPDSTLGVAGLVQAVHSGNVAVANALGSGIVEAPAFLGFLPRLCRHLLGEDLLLPSVPTYWCGDENSRQHVLANLQRMVIKPAFPGAHRTPVFGEMLSTEELATWRVRICEQPFRYVCQERVSLSTSPALIEKHVEPRHVVLRAHLVTDMANANTPGAEFAVMPGGLSRFSATADSLVVSMQSGGGSKDTWVLSDGPVDSFSLLAAAGQVVDISRGGGELPSRVADNLFWLGRYMERAEGIVRLARGITTRLTDQNADASSELPYLMAALHGLTSDEDAPSDGKRSQEKLAQILFGGDIAGGLQGTLDSAHNIASLVRDRISIDTWRIISRFKQDLLAGTSPQVQLNDVLSMLDGLVLSLSAFGGLAMESMTRGHTWRFLDMGRRVERGLGTLTLLKATVVPVPTRESPLLEAVLEVADSAMTYRRRYMTTLQAAPVLDLLLADESNPRSVAFQVARLSEHVEALPHSQTGIHRSPEERILLRTLTALRLADLQAEAQSVKEGDTFRRVGLAKLLKESTQNLQTLSESISHSYLSHAVASRQLSSGLPARTEGT